MLRLFKRMRCHIMLSNINLYFKLTSNLNKLGSLSFFSSECVVQKRLFCMKVTGLHTPLMAKLWNLNLKRRDIVSVTTQTKLNRSLPHDWYWAKLSKCGWWMGFAFAVIRELLVFSCFWGNLMTDFLNLLSAPFTVIRIDCRVFFLINSARNLWDFCVTTS